MPIQRFSNETLGGQKILEPRCLYGGIVVQGPFSMVDDLRLPEYIGCNHTLANACPFAFIPSTFKCNSRYLSQAFTQLYVRDGEWNCHCIYVIVFVSLPYKTRCLLICAQFYAWTEK